MSEGVGPGPVGPARRSFRGRWIPFWGVQAAEIAVAFVFVDISIHVARGGLLVGTAFALAALAVTAQGPLGIVRICGQRLHLLLVTIVSAMAALAPIVPVLRPDIQGIIVIEFGAVGLIRVATLTRTGDPRPAPPGRRRRSRVIDATATVAPPGSPAATTAGSGRSRSPSTGSAARQAGRVSGAAVATGRRVATKYGPEAEEQAKRTIRGIGRAAGKVSARLSPPKDPPG